MTCFGHQSIWLDTVTSTNDYASFLLDLQPPADGYAVIAKEQTKGRGQFGKRWVSNKNENLLVSYIIYPDFLNLGDHFILNVFASLAVRDVLTSFLEEEVLIKWPNDIYVNQKKLAGILIQNAIGQKVIKASVVGIGINVNQSSFDSRAENASSLHMITGEIFNLKKVWEKLNEFMTKYYQMMKLQYGIDTLRSLYTRYLFGLNQSKKFEDLKDHNTFTGIIRGIESSGRLKIDINGKTKAFDLGEIKFIL